MPRGNLRIFACRGGELFAKRVLNNIQRKGYYKRETSLKMGERDVTVFSNGEIKVKINENIRGCDIFIFQALDPNPILSTTINDNLMELIVAIDALKRAKPNHVTAVIPNLGYSRQDVQRGREPISARIVADLLSSMGINGLITLDMHSDQITGMYPREVGVDNMMASTVLIPFFIEEYGDELKEWVFSSLDAGGAARAEHYAKAIGARSAVISKRRRYDEANVVDESHILGRVDNRNIVIIDDMIDTAGSLVEGVKEIKGKGALDVYVACTHALLNKPAVERIDQLYKEDLIKGVIATDTVMREPGFSEKHPWYREVSVSSLIGKTICRINAQQSVSDLYKDKKIAEENEVQQRLAKKE